VSRRYTPREIAELVKGYLDRHSIDDRMSIILISAASISVTALTQVLARISKYSVTWFSSACRHRASAGLTGECGAGGFLMPVQSTLLAIAL
jgi:hypothetical protein